MDLLQELLIATSSDTDKMSKSKKKINKCFSGHFFEKQMRQASRQAGFIFISPPPPPKKKNEATFLFFILSKPNEAPFLFILSIKMLIF